MPGLGSWPLRQKVLWPPVAADEAGNSQTMTTMIKRIMINS